jgi:DNA-binding MarR family transcriptional regulator
MLMTPPPAARAIKTTSQEGKRALAGRLMLALRRSSAAGVLHGQAVARRVGVNSTDLECLDLILMSGPSSAGEIARHTGLTSGAVTGLIDRLERMGLVERAADPADRRKVVVRVREDRIGPIAALYAPLEKSMQALLAGYSKEELKVLIDFAERSGGLLLARVSDLNDSK